jgi:hypothetical protein
MNVASARSDSKWRELDRHQPFDLGLGTDHLAIDLPLTPMFRSRFRRDVPRVPYRRPADDGEEPHDDRL